MICGLIYLTLMSTIMFLCGYFTRERLTEVSEGLNYPTGFMNQVSADWESPPLISLAVSPTGVCPSSAPDIVFGRHFYGVKTGCDCLGITSTRMGMKGIPALAEEIGLGNRTNTIMQAAFFKIANVIPYDKAVEQMKKMIVKSFGSKGEEVVNMNYAAVEAGSDVIKVEVPAEWAKLEVKADSGKRTNVPEFVANVVDPINNLAGDDLPVSAFLGREDGTFPSGTSQYEKRGIAVNVPEWISDNCIQCNQCAYVCPHACIRPFLLDEKEEASLPAGIATIDSKGKGVSSLPSVLYA